MTSQAGMVETLFCVLFFFSRFSQIFKNLPNIFVESIFEQGWNKIANRHFTTRWFRIMPLTAVNQGKPLFTAIICCFDSGM